jgi:4a-hydroxytetrahydrobiopterin dehydratase
MSKPGLVAPASLEAFLLAHPGWVAQGEAQGLTLRKRFPFAAYTRALGFVVAAAEHSERVDHHPDLTLGWRWVVAQLTSHHERGITDRDLALAVELDRIYQEYL